MKTALSFSLLKRMAIISIIVLVCSSCEKDNEPDVPDHGHLQQTKTFSSEVLQAWINFDLRLLRNNATLNNYIMMEHFAYSGIALYEAVVPGMPAYQSLAGQLDQMPVMPATSPGMAYHWPTCANTVLAAMVRNFYKSISEADKVSTDSLENAFNSRYQDEVNAEIFQRSVDFGKAVAQKVFDWSKTDGSLTVHPAYAVPAGPGLWEPTPPALLAPQGPYWGTNRPLVAGIVAASDVPVPAAYSADAASDFFAMVKQVYDASLVLTDDQKAQATFWRDIPGGGTHAHWLSILLQVLNKEENTVMLDKAALVYAKMGITQSDSRISCWNSKYHYNLVRPITYIRSVMNQSTWNSFLTTPNHPEYPSAHSTFSAAAAVVLTNEFGKSYQYTDHSFDFLGLPARSYNSFNEAAAEAGQSRFYAGIHYLPSLTAGNSKGTAIVQYMNSKVKFLKK